MKRLPFVKGFSIILCGDVDLEGMVIDVNFDEEMIGSVNYDKGIENIEIEMISYPEDFREFNFGLDEFIESLNKAKALAIRCAKEDEEMGDS